MQANHFPPSTKQLAQSLFSNRSQEVCLDRKHHCFLLRSRTHEIFLKLVECTFSLLKCVLKLRPLLELISWAKCTKLSVEAPAGVWCMMVSNKVLLTWGSSNPQRTKMMLEQMPCKDPSWQKKLAIQSMNALLGKNSPRPKNSKIHYAKQFSVILKRPKMRPKGDCGCGCLRQFDSQTEQRILGVKSCDLRRLQEPKSWLIWYVVGTRVFYLPSP